MAKKKLPYEVICEFTNVWGEVTHSTIVAKCLNEKLALTIKDLYNDNEDEYFHVYIKNYATLL